MAGYEEIRDLASRHDYTAADAKMSRLLTALMEDYGPLIGKQFSFNHILEVYYYDYFLNSQKQAIQHTRVNLNAHYRLYGDIKLQMQLFEEAQAAYKSALDWNPVDLDSMFSLAELYKRQNQPEECRGITLAAYNYCCTRATLSRYYRNLGFYYLENYQPEIATALYLCSNLCYPSIQADQELLYLEEALQRPTPDLTFDELKTIFQKEDIPAGPNTNTVALTYQVGRLELEKGNIDNAKDCFSMVQDVTGALVEK